MYASFYGFREKPFSLVPDPEFLYLSRRHRAALSMLEFALAEQAGITVITGEIGSGKTTVVRSFLKMVGSDTTIGLITNTHPRGGDLLKWVLFAFGLDYKSDDNVELYDRFIEFLIEQYAANRHTVLIIDEAQNLDVERLESLRVLSNVYDDKEHVLQIILIGQPELLEKLNRPDLKQLAQRVAVNFHLGPLTLKETAAYIRHRLMIAGGKPDILDEAACAAVYCFSKGVPRLINILCDSALVYGFAEDQLQIDIDTILSVVEDRKQGGLAVFTPSAGSLERTKILAEIDEMRIESKEEQEPPEYDVATQAEMRGPENEPESAKNGPPGSEILPDSPQGIRELQGMAAQEKPDPEATLSWPLDLSGPDEVAKPKTRSKHQRRHVRASLILMAATVIGFGIFGTVMHLSDRQLMSNLSEWAGRQAALAQVLVEAYANGEHDASKASDDGPGTSLGEKPTEAPGQRMAEEGIPKEEGGPAPIATTATIPKEPGAASAAQDAQVQSAIATNAANPKEPETASAIQDSRTQNPVGATATSLKKSEEILLEDLFRQPDRLTDTKSATAILFAMWNIDYSGFDGSDLCANAVNSGFACLKGKGSLARLANLNRPAMITLSGPNGKRLDAVISSLDGSSIILRIAGLQIESTVGEIASSWSGEFVILWKPPAVYNRLLQQGLEGPDVAWVRRRLTEINGLPAINSDELKFDSKLKEDVIAFQRSHSLEPDGVVGPRTLIHLNDAAGIEGIPSLKVLERYPSGDS